eukprot:SAG31_NODE_13207_length_886_cov_0.860229_1_plen_253_part_01
MQTSSINQSLTNGRIDDVTMGFASQEQYSAALTLAADASVETRGAIAAHQPQGSYFRARPPPWLAAAMAELSWPAVPGAGEDRLTLPDNVDLGPPAGTPSGQRFWRHDPRGWNKDNKLPCNQDLRTDYARQFLAEQGAYAPPSEHKFRDAADPQAHGHQENFERFVHNREPSVRPFESMRTGPYRPPASHSFRSPSKATVPFDTVFPPKPKHIDLGTVCLRCIHIVILVMLLSSPNPVCFALSLMLSKHTAGR